MREVATMNDEEEDELLTRYYSGEMCPECGDDEGLTEHESDDGKTYLECKKCGAISNDGEPGGGHTFI